MVVRSMGAATLALLMRTEREAPLVTDWLLFGPEDPGTVEAEAPPPVLLAAE